LVAVVGSVGSGKTSLLEQATGVVRGSSSLADPEEFVWWSVQGRFFVEVPASYCRDGDSSLRKKFCDQLSDWYPERPLSAVVVLVPITLFQSADSDAQTTLQGISDTIRQFSDYVQYALPVHIILTFTDSVPGFEAFSRSSDLLDKKELLSFFSLDYRRPRDVSQNLDSWIGGIQELIMRSVVSGKVPPLQSNLHELLQFGPSMELLLPKLSAWVNSITANVSHLPNLVKVEAILLTGKMAQAPLDENLSWWATPESIQNLEFVRTPSEQFSIKYTKQLRRRAALAFAACMLSVCVFAIWVPSTVSSVDESTKVLMSVATDLNHAQNVSETDRMSLSSETTRIDRIFAQVHSLAAVRTWFFLVPSSWLNNFKDVLFSEIGFSIQKDFIAPAMSSLSYTHLELPDLASTSLGGVSAPKVEDLSSFRALDIFLDRQEIRSSSIKAAEKLSSGLSYKDLMVLVNDDPSRIPVPAWEWSSSLPQKLIDQFHFEMPSTVAMDSSIFVQPIGVLCERILIQTVEENPTLKIATEIFNIGERFRRSSEVSYEDTYRLAQLMRDFQVEVEKPLSGVILNKQAQSLRYMQPVLSRLSGSSVVPISKSVELSNDFVKRRDLARNRLLGMDQGFFGRIFMLDVDTDRLVLSPEFKKTSNAFGVLLSSRFMQPQSFSLKDVEIETDYFWQLSKLEHVKALSSTFQQFLNVDIQLFDVGIRPQLIRMARQQYRRTVQSEFLGALAPVPTSSAFDRFSPTEGLVVARSQLESLSAVLRLRKQSWSPDDVGAGDVVGDLLQAQVLRVLVSYERLLLQEDPYAGLASDVLRWLDSSQVSRPLSTHVRGGVKEQLLSIRERIRSQYIVQVSDLLANADSLSASFQKADAVKRWRKIIEAVDSLDKGDANSALFEFEQYFLALSKLPGADECAQFLAERSDIKIRDDFFSRRLVKVDEALVDGCNTRGSDGKRRVYSEFADFFNKNIAGHPPFALPGRLQDPVSRRSFALMSDSYLSMRKRIGDSVSSSWPQPVRGFLSQMDSLMLRSSGSAPVKAETGSVAKPSQLAVRAKLIFNTHAAQSLLADHIISWSIQSGPRKYSLRNPKDAFVWELGDPIEVQFRWASDSSFSPVAPLGEFGRYTVSDRTATFRFNSDWALFDLIRQQSAGGDPYDSVALKFEMDVIGSDRRATSKAFVTLQSVDGGGALELDLPTMAPTLSVKTERSSAIPTAIGSTR